MSASVSYVLECRYGLGPTGLVERQTAIEAKYSSGESRPLYRWDSKTGKTGPWPQPRWHELSSSFRHSFLIGLLTDAGGDFWALAPRLVSAFRSNPAGVPLAEGDLSVLMVLEFMETDTAAAFNPQFWMAALALESQPLGRLSRLEINRHLILREHQLSVPPGPGPEYPSYGQAYQLAKTLIMDQADFLRSLPQTRERQLAQ